MFGRNGRSSRLGSQSLIVAGMEIGDSLGALDYRGGGEAGPTGFATPLRGGRRARRGRFPRTRAAAGRGGGARPATIPARGEGSGGSAPARGRWGGSRGPPVG